MATSRFPGPMQADGDLTVLGAFSGAGVKLMAAPGAPSADPGVPAAIYYNTSATTGVSPLWVWHEVDGVWAQVAIV